MPLPFENTPVTSEDVQRRRLFSTWRGGYSQKQVDEFVTNVTSMLSAYESGSVTPPHLTSSEVKTKRFRVAWNGYQPDQVDEYIAGAVDALMAYETTLATLALSKPGPPSEPTPMLTVLGSFLGATAASVALHVQSVSADHGFVLSVSSYVLTAVVALFSGGLGYFLQPAKKKWVAVVLGVVGWVLGVLAGLSLTLSLMIGYAIQGL